MDGDGPVAGRRYEEVVLVHEHKGPNIALVRLSHALGVLVVLQLGVVDVVIHLKTRGGGRGENCRLSRAAEILGTMYTYQNCMDSPICHIWKFV